MTRCTEKVEQYSNMKNYYIINLKAYKLCFKAKNIGTPKTVATPLKNWKIETSKKSTKRVYEQNHSRFALSKICTLNFFKIWQIIRLPET